MSDPMPTILNILTPPAHAIIIARHADRLEGFCSRCGFYIESMGRDESSRMAVSHAFDQHLKEGTK